MIQSEISSLDPLHDEQFHSDDISAGKMFCKIISPWYRYNVTAISWMFYDGKRWVKDEGDASVEKAAQSFQRALAVYCVLNIPEPKKQSDEEKAFSKFTNKLANRSHRVTMIKDAAPYLSISYSDLDKENDLLNCLNGTLNLRTLEFREHNQEDMLSMTTGCNYDPNARCDAWINFLDQIMEGDKGKISYLQKICGYALTADISQEQSFILYGSTSRNGKSTFLETIGAMMGDYSITANPAIFEDRTKNSSNASPDIAALDGKRLIRISEIPRRMLFNSSLFKQLTGGDKLRARFLYEDGFDFRPVGKFVFNTNHLPVINDNSVFASDRLKVIEFNRHFNESEQDKTLKGRLTQPEELSGILNWCIQGLTAYLDEGLVPPNAVQIATENFHSDSDKLHNFIKECMDDDIHYSITMKEAYAAYVIWCRENGYGTDSKSSFKADLQSRGLLKNTGTVRGKTVYNVIPGYDLTQDFQNEHFAEL